MGWRFTGDVEAFHDRMWDFLSERPVENTVALTVLHSLLRGHGSSTQPPLLAWYDDGGRVRGVVMHTPPYEMLLTAVPEDTTAELVAALRTTGAAVPGVNGDVATVARFAEQWVAGTPLNAVTWMHQRLYRLESLHAPPAPPGRARAAEAADLDLALTWARRFREELSTPVEGVEASVRDWVEHGRLWLWEDAAGATAAAAARTPTTAGVARVCQVYTPPELRRRGYGAAVTAGCSADALEHGVQEVVLFTDLADPTANSVYQAIGYRPVRDIQVVRFQE